MLCAIWYYFYDLKNVKKHPWRRATVTKNNTPPWMFFTFFKSCKWYQTAQSITITDKQITQ